MFWQTIQDFLTDNANLIALIAGLIVLAGVLVARGLWMYRRVSRSDKPTVPAGVAATIKRVTKEARHDETRKRGRPGRSA